MIVRRIASGLAFGATASFGLGLFASPAMASGTHGTTIVSVRALPLLVQMQGGRAGPLASSKLNVVTASTALGFKVEIRNHDASQKKNVSATLTIRRPASQGGPLISTATVAVIGPRQTKTVTIHQLGAVPFAERTNLTIKVVGGPARVYPVIFSLPSGNGAGVGSVANNAGSLTVAPVVGLDERAALTRLQAQGFEVLVVQVHSSHPAEQVVAQSPSAGGHLLRGQIVKINVSNGKK